MAQHGWKKRILGALALAAVTVAATGFFSVKGAWADVSNPTATTQAAAGAATGACPGLYPCPPWGTFLSLQTTNKEMLQPTLGVVLWGLIANALTFVADRVAYDTAMYLATGDKGQAPLFFSDSPLDAWSNFGLDTVGDALGTINEVYNPPASAGQFTDNRFDQNGNYLQTTVTNPDGTTSTRTLNGAEYSDNTSLGGSNSSSLFATGAAKFLNGFNLCQPPNPAIALSISISVKANYARPKPKCEWASVSRNWQSAWANIVQTNSHPVNEAMKGLADSFRPGKNEVGIALGTNLKVLEDVAIKRNILQQDKNSKGGFKDVTDIVTGQVKTPSAFVVETAKKNVVNKDGTTTETTVGALNNPSLSEYGAAFAAHVGSVFVNTLIGNGFLQRIYNGLFTPPAPTSTSLGDFGAAPGLTTVSAALSSVSAVSPINVSNYDALSEFVVCPSGVVNRGINNCVMDSSFASAISRGSSGLPLTVKEAVDQGLLHGDWPLISNNDTARNQDSLCYTQGYCYGNLVKMRRARIVSVGWEMAAQLSRPEKPYTLKQVMDAFNDCKGNPSICHLIDPDWVLKYPVAQCRAQVTGELLASSAGPNRNTYCADVQDCVSERPDGTCAAFGYCVREKNTWKFKGDACPAQYASCLAFTDKSTNKQSSFLLNTVDYGTCTQQNAGCLWYATTQALDTKGTVSTADDTFTWKDSSAAGSREYFNGNVQQCSASDEGCTKLTQAAGVSLNMVGNPGFETDDNSDGVPDGWAWTGAVGTFSHDGHGYLGSRNSITLGAGSLTQAGIALAPNVTYTLSAYGTGTAAGSASLKLVKADGTAADLSGVSVVGSCAVSGNTMTLALSASAAFQRATCTFSAGPAATFGTLSLSGNAYTVDAIQLEAGESASGFAEGYNPASAAVSYLKAPPSYLGCTGADADPAACAAYAGSCQAQDVGCMLYQPAGGGTNIPATTTAADRCPAECVGYAAFKQEATPYDSAQFPVSFIPSKAKACSAQYVGCDSFTNLNSVARGGEGVEYYTKLRACDTTADAGPASSTYFTWEGSENTGYQLKTWQLLKSAATNAPCTSWHTEDMNGGVGSVHPRVACDAAEPAADTSCSTHADALTNPDCREFYDQDGVITYRLFSKTVTVNDSCTAYRKTTADQASCAANKGLWIGSGECRYLGLATESASCPAEANGCRAYTGGSGNNVRTVDTQDFEDTNNFTAPPAVSFSGTTVTTTGVQNVVVKQSGESIATGGHSMSVQADAAGKGIISLNTENGVTTSAFKGKLLGGRTYTVSFWAKGSTSINGGFVEKATTLVSGQSATLDSFASGVQLDATWRQYTFGPFSGSPTFDDTAALYLTAQAPGTFYVDNFSLTQSGDAVTVVKGSWVVPASCDTAPNGAAAPQYYLGCQAYTDQKQQTGTFYQFTRLCSEKVVGCQAFYDTRNSSQTGGKISNLRCVKQDGIAVTSGTACVVNGQTYCTIASGQTACFFDVSGSTPPPKATGTSAFDIVVGSETRAVPNDGVTYLVDNGSASCSAAAAGCRAFGKPVFNQDRSSVASYQSVYLLDQPDNYSNILCTDDALFCKAWSTTSNGTYFFKDPGDKTCEYKTNVRLDGGDTYDGWFKKGTNQPCYANNIVGGRTYGVWRNGDEQYQGWVGSCPQSNDRCTEFLDPTDTSQSNAGKAYDFVNNDILDQSSNQGPGACKGQVSRKGGCALFRDGNITDFSMAAGPTYVLSTHADVLTPSGQADILVDPIDCRNVDSGKKVYKKSDGSNPTVDLCALRCQYTVGAQVGLNAAQQLRFPADSTHIYTDSCLVDTDCGGLMGSDNLNHKGTCVDTSALPVGGQALAASLRYQNDTNRVLKVQRDRSCGEWLTCASSRSTWNSNTNKYEQICDGLELCSKAGPTDNAGSCAQTGHSKPQLLATAYYQSRDISWKGEEYAGYSIPNVLPVDLLQEVNIAPAGTAAQNTLGFIAGSCPISTTDGTSCKVGTCEFSGNSCSNDGNCDTRRSEQCLIGFCQQQKSPKGTCQGNGLCQGGTNNGQACAGDANCGGGGSCLPKLCQSNTDCGVGGYCNQRSFCFNDTDCQRSWGSGYSCDQDIHLCVDVTAASSSATKCGRTTDAACGSGSTCRLRQGTKDGTCYSGLCMTAPRDSQNLSVPDPLSKNTALPVACRAYPESDSPFPSRLVTAWASLTGGGASPADKTSKPSALRKGFDQVNIFAPVYRKPDGVTTGSWVSSNNDFDSCQYQRVDYGNGGNTKYYPVDVNGFDNTANRDTGLSGICSGGDNDGAVCAGSGDCTNGQCLLITKKQTLYGWPGYCLEKDSSIQEFGNQDLADRPCLTWLPVDQLRSATDLFGKYWDAGFKPAGTETDYCADIKTYYDFSTSRNTDGTVHDNLSGNVACAETIYDTRNDVFWSSCKEADTTKAEWFDKESCWMSAYCPQNYFAVISGCGGEEPSGTSGQCHEGAFADSDCPYFCVPLLGFHSTPTTDISASACLPPGFSKSVTISSGGTPHVVVFKNQQNGSEVFNNPAPPSHVANMQDPKNEFGSLSMQIFLAPKDKFEQMYNYYKDCTAQGIPKDVADTMNAVVDPNGQNGFGVKPSNQCQGTGTSCTTDTDCGNDVHGNPISCVPVAFTTTPPPSTPNRCDGGDNRVCTCNGNDCDNVATCKINGTQYKCKGDNTVGYRNLGLLDKSYAACSSLTQVSSPSLVSQGSLQIYNQAWTNRLWKGKTTDNKDQFASIQDSNDYFKYTNATVPSGFSLNAGFGEALSPTVLKQAVDQINPNDGRPQDVVQCVTSPVGRVQRTIELAKPNNSCPQNDDEIEPHYSSQNLFARAYFQPLDNVLPAKETMDKVWGRLGQIFATSSVGGYTWSDGQSFALKFILNHSGSAPASDVWGYYLGNIKNDPVGSTQGPLDYLGGQYSLSGTKMFSSSLTKTGDTTKKPTPPVVMGIGDCTDGLCKEGQAGTFNVNNQTDGRVTGGNGQKHIVVSFFTYADPDQLPIRKILVDWGDGDVLSSTSSGNKWPTTSQSGSTSSDNAYKNHRGLDAAGKKICDSLANWGMQPSACDPSYVSFTHDYTCPADYASKLPACKFVDGHLVGSPCTGGDVVGSNGSCVYEPRVHVMDNWGWCTGTCKTGADNTDSCYDDSWESKSNSQGNWYMGTNECDAIRCPGPLCEQQTADAPTHGAGYPANPNSFGEDPNRDKMVNPWVYFKGQVIVQPLGN